MGFFDFLTGKKDENRPAADPRKSLRKQDIIGEVEGFFKKPGAAVIKIKKGPLHKGDEIWIVGHTTDLKFVIGQMQIDRQDIESADKGQIIGIKVKKRVRRGDVVYRVPAPA